MCMKKTLFAVPALSTAALAAHAAQERLPRRPVPSAALKSGETDTARWMTGAAAEKK